jgi:undecaprenyl-diphosphatase
VSSWFRRRIDWLRSQDLILLAALSVIGILVLAFIKLASEVGEMETSSFDRTILMLFRTTPSDPVGSPSIEAAVMHISALGSVAVTSLIVLIVVGFCFLAGHWRYGLLVLACSAGTGIIMSLLKGFYGRERPDYVTHLDPPGGLSFPSGHSMISAALYMTLAALIANTLERRRLKIFVICTGAFLTLLIGVSRMYLGVHYPTDVIAGWTAGGIWALACGLVARWLGKRGAVPTPTADLGSVEPEQKQG